MVYSFINAHINKGCGVQLSHRFTFLKLNLEITFDLKPRQLQTSELLCDGHDMLTVLPTWFQGSH